MKNTFFEKVGLTGLGVISVVLLAIGFFIRRPDFYAAYLQGYTLWTSASLGFLGLLMIFNLVGGRWGVALGNYLIAGARTLPLMAVLVLPLLVGAAEIYPWWNPTPEMAEIVATKRIWLNGTAFVIRSVFYVVVWVITARLVEREAVLGQGRKAASAIGIVVTVLTGSFAALDWLMSLEPDWFSSIFGGIYLAGGFLLALVLLILILKARPMPMEGLAQAEILHDIGKLLLMSVMVWAYFSFSQYLILWSGQIPKEMAWYRHRATGGWEYFGGALIVFHFVVPFMLLLSRRVKRDLRLLFVVSSLLLVMRVVEMVWITGPSRSPGHFRVEWMPIAAAVAMGSLWVLYYMAMFNRVKPLVRTA